MRATADTVVAILVLWLVIVLAALVVERIARRQRSRSLRRNPYGPGR